MVHYSAEMWLQYVEGTIEEALALEMEDHLCRCGACLKLYALAAESLVSEQVSPQFTDAVMAKVTVSGNDEASEKPCPLIVSRQTPKIENTKQSLFNYAVAACLTLLLTAAGIFGQVSTALPAVTDADISLVDTASEKISSGWSKVIAEKTLSIIDTIKPD
jgi:hypothetical protein